MDEQHIVGTRLVAFARPYLDRGDREGLAERLTESWSSECLALLLGSQDDDIVEVATSSLALIADMPACAPLARLLHHPSETIGNAAEDALWAIWFRAGGRLAQSVLTRIARTIEAGESENAVSMLTELLRSHPKYAEAYHQRSQAHYLEDRFDATMRDAQRAIKLNPWHFGAMANRAHALVGLGRMQDALNAYRKVLTLHPRMPGIRTAIRHLRRRLTPVGS